MNDIKNNPLNNFHNYKGKKKSLPISINTNILPCQFIFNRPISKIAISYINIGQKIQNQNHQKTKSNMTNNVLKNPYNIINNHSRQNNNSIIKTNQNLTSVTHYNKKKENSSSLSHRETYYHSRKKTPVYYQKPKQESRNNDYKIPKKHLIIKNPNLIISKPIKKQKQTFKNYQFEHNSTCSNIINISNKNNLISDKIDNINKKQFISLNHNKKQINKSCNVSLPQKKRMLSHENINIPFNKKFKNEIKDNNLKKGVFKNFKNSVSKENMSCFNKNNPIKNISSGKKKNRIIIHNKKNPVPKGENKIDYHKIIKQVKLSKEKKEFKTSNSKKNLNDMQLSIDDSNYYIKNIYVKEHKIVLSEPSLSNNNIFQDKKEKIIKNKEYNELFNEENLFELPNDLDDQFDDLNSIVRKIKFNLVIVNKENFFSQNYQIYQNFKQEFESDFGLNHLHKLKRIYCSLDKEKNKITERRNYNNMSFSTQANSSNKKIIQSQNSLISPIISKFNLNL